MHAWGPVLGALQATGKCTPVGTGSCCVPHTPFPPKTLTVASYELLFLLNEDLFKTELDHLSVYKPMKVFI